MSSHLLKNMKLNYVVYGWNNRYLISIFEVKIKNITICIFEICTYRNYFENMVLFNSIANFPSLSLRIFPMPAGLSFETQLPLI